MLGRAHTRSGAPKGVRNAWELQPPKADRNNPLRSNRLTLYLAAATAIISITTR